MFDIIGGFVVKFLPATSLGRLRDVLRGLSFDCIDLDGARIDGKASLHEALYHAMNLTTLCPGSANSAPNWDSLSDLFWQWVMGEAGHEVTKLAFVIENATALLARDAELVFQFAEIAIHLETIVRQAREEEAKPALQVRVFLVG
jgi:hypothetical protein